MFTVRHVERDGRERVLQVDSIERTPEGKLVFGTVQEITTGRVFVMNETGQTVASYNFDKKE